MTGNLFASGSHLQAFQESSPVGYYQDKNTHRFFILKNSNIIMDNFR
jgi:hypothetical protein